VRGSCKILIKFAGCVRHWQPPFNGYENASKQFERSVNAVQQMLSAHFNGLIFQSFINIVPRFRR
jgi:hypothetical protein